jgi:hypothetical protein
MFDTFLLLCALPSPFYYQYISGSVWEWRITLYCVQCQGWSERMSDVRCSKHTK